MAKQARACIHCVVSFLLDLGPVDFTKNKNGISKLGYEIINKYTNIYYV